MGQSMGRGRFLPAPLSVASAIASAFLSLVIGTPANAADLPPGFEEVTICSGLDYPTAMAFAPDGRIFVALKKGEVRVVTAAGVILPDPFVTVAVEDYWDRGLVGIAVDPDFTHNGWVYIDYVSSMPPAHPPRSDSRVQRVVRFTASGNVALAGSEHVVLDGIASDSMSHMGGCLRFGSDGALFVSTGDGSNFIGVDSMARRAQDVDNLNGKILRIDPATGDGLPDNPFYAGAQAIRSKVWYFGLRHPWRFAVLPGTSTVAVGDVGWDDWEEIDVSTPGANFGWPCYEGPLPQPAYAAAFPTACSTPLTAPAYAYDHGGIGAAITAIEFITGPNYPAEYRGSLLFADFVHHWVKRAVLGPANEIDGVTPFADGDDTFNVVDLQRGRDGNVYYLDVASDFSIPSGSIVRIQYVGVGNLAPVPHPTASPSFGDAPLDVRLSSAGSYDPDGAPLTYLWTFDDGSPTSTEASPIHRYAANGIYHPILAVSDGQAVRTAPVTVTVGSRPPRVAIVSPVAGFFYEDGQTIPIQARVLDRDDGAVPESSIRWTVILHHDEHVHPFVDGAGSSGSFVAATHGDGHDSVHYEIVFTATDSTGLTSAAHSEIFPLRNIALGRPAIASSSQPFADFTGEPDDAVDGIITDARGLVSGWHAAPGSTSAAWWQVDLGARSRIRRVEMVARPNADQPEARREFEVVGSDDPTFATSAVLASQGSEPFPAFDTWTAVVTEISPFRYVRVRKTVAESPFNFAEFRVFGGAAPGCDLALLSAQVDVDPSDPDVDSGDAGVGQPVDVVVVVENDGTTPIVGATIRVAIGMAGSAATNVTEVFDDFDSAGGVQPLDPSRRATLRIAIPAHTLTACGSYTLGVTNQALLLQCAGGLRGDGDGANDRVVVANAVVTRLADLSLTISSDSETIDDPTTEPVLVAVDFTGLGPGGDRRDVQIIIDVLEAGSVARSAVRTLNISGVHSDAAATRTLQLDLRTIAPPLEVGRAYAVAFRILERGQAVECASAVTSNTFTIQP
ncbi:MAG: PQQ-dependent sugar dehydrogenase [Planctomycetes bacterium]|nr:PQQ-dependent sugar dehydrogenase [Planctomycetota bacterium]